MKLRLSLSGEKPDPELPALWDRFDAVGMIRSEYLLRYTGAYWTDPATRDFVAAYVEEIASMFSPRPVWYRAADLWTDEANPLQGIDEICEEDNPIVGRRGTRRGLLLPDAFETEIRHIAGVARAHRHLHLMMPFVGDADEFSRALDIVNRAGWPNGVGSMLEIPSAVLDARRFHEAGATNLMVGLNDLTCLLTGSARASGFDSKTSRSVWWCLDYLAASIGTACEWGIAGSLSKELLEKAERSGVPYASLHYAELPQLLGIDRSDLRDVGLVGEIKHRTRTRAKEFARRRLDGGGMQSG